jgi:hypothetical protein
MEGGWSHEKLWDGQNIMNDLSSSRELRSWKIWIQGIKYRWPIPGETRLRTLMAKDRYKGQSFMQGECTWWIVEKLEISSLTTHLTLQDIGNGSRSMVGLHLARQGWGMLAKEAEGPTIYTGIIYMMARWDSSVIACLTLRDAGNICRECSIIHQPHLTSSWTDIKGHRNREKWKEHLQLQITGRKEMWEDRGKDGVISEAGTG